LQSAETYLTLPSELEIIDTLSKNTGQRLYFHETTTFTGVFLDEESRVLLKSRFPPIQGWNQYYHHMTICIGNIESNQVLKLDRKSLGKTVTLEVVAVGKDHRAYAAKVNGFPSINPTPHITMCVVTSSPPKCANEIMKWDNIEPFTLQGKILEHKRFTHPKKKPKKKIKWNEKTTTKKTQKKVNLGKLIGELTTKKGKDQVEAVKVLTKWMDDNGIENSEENVGKIKKYIYDNFL